MAGRYAVQTEVPVGRTRGNIDVSTVRDDTFEVGKEYYVDFTPAEGAE